MPLVLRDIDKTHDLARCAEIWFAASAVGHPFLPEADRRAEADLVRTEDLPAAESIVAEADGRIVGYISLWDGFVGALFVDPACHGRGIGRRLVEAASTRKGRLVVEVYALNAAAVGFYTATGFAEVARRATDHEGRSFTLLRMERALSGP